MKELVLQTIKDPQGALEAANSYRFLGEMDKYEAGMTAVNAFNFYFKGQGNKPIGLKDYQKDIWYMMDKEKNPEVKPVVKKEAKKEPKKEVEEVVEKKKPVKKVVKKKAVKKAKK